MCKHQAAVQNDKIHHGCMCCGGTSPIASLNELVFSDDGTITKDGKQIWPPCDEPVNPGDWVQIVTGQKGDPDTKPLSYFEEMAKKEPDADWRFTFVKAMRDGVYQRQGEGKWVLIESGRGYA